MSKEAYVQNMHISRFLGRVDKGERRMVRILYMRMGYHTLTSIPTTTSVSYTILHLKVIAAEKNRSRGCKAITSRVRTEIRGAKNESSPRPIRLYAPSLMQIYSAKSERR